MGTRNLTAVMIDGEYKVAQYGQWDGYPDGQGMTALMFLSTPGMIDKLKANLGKVRFLDANGRDKDFADSYDKNAPTWSNEPDKRTPEQRRWFSAYISRDLGADILHNIAESDDAEIILKNSIDFANDSLFCEWAYVIDFDENTFEVFSGFNNAKESEGRRFCSDDGSPAGDTTYYAVKPVKVYRLDALPTPEQFLADFSEDEEDESA